MDSLVQVGLNHNDKAIMTLHDLMDQFPHVDVNNNVYGPYMYQYVSHISVLEQWLDYGLVRPI